MSTAGSKQDCEEGDRSPAQVGAAPPPAAPRKQPSPIPLHPTSRTEIPTGYNSPTGQDMKNPLEELEHRQWQRLEHAASLKLVTDNTAVLVTPQATKITC